ncbi:flagellar filament capping protein FliD [Heliorestis acidaminivorans]|uniref:Flagellar hook-associated protein 2 n=1 Tax=Heliorestis acidaminivorans TaxID=553427 RepID=A0A6I0F4L5_9FIRM|nr:flagellar filament capping protein FliD [Heliorestis acidaminivorans]KAB2953617.1 flagellar filament capping protein FliD [Heliorestis acidaminivorans]
MTIRFGGIASGLDTESIIKEMMRAHRMRGDKLFHEKTRTEWRKAEYHNVRNDIISFRNKLFDVFNRTNKMNPKTVNSSNNDIVTATATSDAGTVTNMVRVEQLASGVNLTSGSKIGVESNVDGKTIVDKSSIITHLGFRENDLQLDEGGNLALHINGAEIKINPAKETINDLARKINNANVGVRASYDANYDQFFLRTTSTGSNATINFGPSPIPEEELEAGEEQPTMSASEANLWNALNLHKSTGTGTTAIIIAEEQSGENAKIKVNGFDFEGATNNITVAGVTYNLQKVELDTDVTITVGNNIDGAVETIKEFVKTYNELVTKLNDLTRQPFYRDFNPLTEEQRRDMSDREVEMWEEKARSGLLRNDSMLNSFLSTMRLNISEPIDGLESNYKSLASIGITTSRDWTKGGFLEFEENPESERKLRAALEEDPEILVKLFMGSEGVISRLRDTAQKTTDQLRDHAGSSPAADPNSFLGRRLSNFERQLATFEDRMKRTEDRYWRQFTAMEKAMDKMNSQSSWLMQQFANF